MKIETKFNIGDMVYCIETANRIVKCNMCDGAGVIADMELEEYECPKCNGMGTIFNGIKTNVIGPYKITGFSINRGDARGFKIEDYKEKYFFDNLNNYEEAPNIIGMEYDKNNIKIFNKKEQAQRCCKNLNRRK